MGGAGERARRLVDPVFVVALALLVVNDHLLKARFPGWWTGKLSDLAGVVVVAVALTVVARIRVAAVVTALAFAALKLAPGAAEASAPLLGGTTHRDATDLVALAALVPLVWWLERRDGAERPAPPLPAVRRTVANAAGVALAVAAIGAGTATSCAEPASVVNVSVVDGVLVAQLANSYESEWATSDDGGWTWTAVPGPGGVERAHDRAPDGTTGAVRACASPGRCWTIGGGRAIRREQAGGTGEVEWVASDEPAHADGCWVGSLPRPVAITVPTGGQPVVAVGEAGVVVRDDEGAWEQVAVLDAEPPVPAQPQAYSWAVLLMAPVLAVLVIALRPLLPRWPWALLVVAIGSAATFLMEFAVMFLVLERRADVFVVFGLVATAVASIAVGRSGAHPSPPVGPPLRPG